jgi:hypothetical protein
MSFKNINYYLYINNDLKYFSLIANVLLFSILIYNFETIFVNINEMINENIFN